MIKINRIFIFLFLTFLLSWGFDGLLIFVTGLDPYLHLGMSPWGMLVPAFIALVLQLFFFKDSPIYYKIYKEKPRWILFGFLVLTVVYAIIVWTAAFFPELKQILQGVGALLFTLWTLLVFFLYGQSPKKVLQKSGLELGNIKVGQRFLVGIIVFLLLQGAFNLLFDLGDFVGKLDRVYGLPVPSALYFPALIILFIGVTAIGIPLSGLAGVFGEEYGWRGFLLQELIPVGKIRAVLWVGVVWGIWHFPVIIRGVHTYPASLLGLSLAIIFFVLWGMIQGYALLKTGSIWVVSFMHGLVNSIYSFILRYGVKPADKVYSFGLGIYGLICLGVVIWFILRDPIWNHENNETG